MLDLRLQIDAVDQSGIEQLDDLDPGGLGQIILRIEYVGYPDLSGTTAVGTGRLPMDHAQPRAAQAGPLRASRKAGSLASIRS
jgi:hypothetical protein